MGKYEIDEDFDNEIYDLGGITKEMPKLLMANEDETVINLFIVMEGNVRKLNEEMLEKGKELVFLAI
jgi:hypothetical protein